MITTKKTVTCDLCGRELEESPVRWGFLGNTYIIAGMVGTKAKADICDDCKEIIRTKRIEREGNGNEQDEAV